MRCPINWTPKRCGYWGSRGNRGGPYGPPLLSWGAGGLWPPDWLEQLWLSSHSAGNRGAARPCARHSPSKGPAPLAEPCRESDLSGAGPVSARTFKSRTCTGPLIIRGPVCGRFPSGGAGPEHGDAACGDVLRPFPPAPADRPSPVAGQGTPKGKKCVLPAAGDARPKGLKPGEGPRSAPSVGPEQARAHKRGGLGGCNISAVRQLRLYGLRRGTLRARNVREPGR